MSIVQGDNGIIIPFVAAKPTVVNLTGATVEVSVKRGDNLLTKVATVIDAVNGKCEFTLSNSDLTVVGSYFYQWKATFSDGRILHGRKEEIYVSEKIAGSPPSTGGGDTGGSGLTAEDWLGGETVTIDTSTADTTPPTNVTNLQATNVAATSLTLSWTAVSDAASYEVYRGTTLLGTATSTTYNVTGLTASTSYQFTVKAKDAAGNVASGTTITQSTTAPSSDTTAPDNVTNLTTSNVTSTGVTLSWTASASSDVASYDVYNGSTLLANVTGTTYNVTGLTASTQYTFTVKAKDAANNVASGTSVTITTSAPDDTTAPVLTITPGGTFTDTQTVTMSTNETATIWYTLDDSDPKTSGTRVQYTSALTLTETDTVKAYAVDTAGNESAVQTVTYTKQGVITTLASDDFNRADTTNSTGFGTSSSGHTWEYFNSLQKWVVLSNQAAQGSPSNNDASAVINVNTSNAKVSTKITNANSGNGLVFRLVDSNNYYRIFKYTNSQFYIQKRVAGAFTLIQSPSMTIAVGDVLSVSCNGSNFEVFKNGVSVTTFTDSALTGTRFGLHEQQGSTTANFDDFKIESV